MEIDARDLWIGFETIHVVTYFHPLCLEALATAGAKGFWMGYFAGRLAPMGAVGPDVATAVCFGFSPTRTARALPDAWTHVDPVDVCAIRATAAATALRTLVPGIDGSATEMIEPLEALTAGLAPGGRALAAANMGVPRPANAVERLWQSCTTLREHRGDTHVAIWVARGFDGVQANVLACAASGRDPEDLRASRDWSTEAWAAAADQLVGQGLVTMAAGGAVRATPDGRALQVAVEQRTDELAAASYASLPTGELDQVSTSLRAIATQVAASGALRYPNPIGLPRR